VIEFDDLPYVDGDLGSDFQRLTRSLLINKGEIRLIYDQIIGSEPMTSSEVRPPVWKNGDYS
jgi:hypothetical protein